MFFGSTRGLTFYKQLTSLFIVSSFHDFYNSSKCQNSYRFIPEKTQIVTWGGNGRNGLDLMRLEMGLYRSKLGLL